MTDSDEGISFEDLVFQYAKDGDLGKAFAAITDANDLKLMAEGLNVTERIRAAHLFALQAAFFLASMIVEVQELPEEQEKEVKLISQYTLRFLEQHAIKTVLDARGGATAHFGFEGDVTNDDDQTAGER